MRDDIYTFCTSTSIDDDSNEDEDVDSREDGDDEHEEGKKYNITIELFLQTANHDKLI